MSLEAGRKLGPYEIVEPIGKGGMGEVYRARDTKLDRDVAIKVLPDEFANDEESLARFEREAKLLAALNHPNIASIYGFESGALVLEFVEGPTLAERIEQGPIPVDEALAIAKQIAEALEAGHDARIIHRDLKPANIKLKEDGTVRVLDYGLAKALEGEATSGSDSGLSQSPTLTRQGTQVGVILGTAAYMSPEQATGQVLDKRSDIFSFGSVLYEMLAGRQAFAGATVSDILATILKTEPEWSQLPSTMDPVIRRLLHRCLEKDRNERQRDISDVRLEIQGVLAEPVSERNEVGSGLPKPTGSRRTVALLIATALVVGVLVSLAVWNMRPSQPPRLMRFGITLPSEDTLVSRPVVSPDGTSVVYAANGQIYLRAMDQMTASPIRGTEGGAGLSGSRDPFFSPDGLWLGFVNEGKLRKVSVTGGAPVTLCDAGSLHGASWGPNDTIVFEDGAGRIFSVSADGGTPELLISAESDEGELSYFPQILPDGEAMLFTVAIGRNWDQAKIVVQSLETEIRRVLVEGGADARYMHTGHLVYAVGQTLMAVPFDVSRLEVTGSPVPVVEGVSRATSGWTSGAASFSLSRDGSLVFLPRGIGRGPVLVFVDREGAVEPMPAPPNNYALPRLSPDGERLAVGIAGDVWVYDIARAASTRLTTDATNSYVGWMPDGKHVAFSSTGKHAMLWRAADGSGASGQFMSGDPDPLLDAVSPDGRFVAFHEHRPATNADLWVLPVETGKPRPFLVTTFLEHGMTFSPDGQAVAYVSNESGRDEVYVRPFPGPGGKIPISTEGGNAPVWARSGRELFYRNEDKMMAVDITAKPELEAGIPRLLFEGRFASFGSLANFDVMPDDQRFVMIQEDPQSRTQFNVVLNWHEELKRLVPTDH